MLSYRKKYGVSDFSPKSQDEFCVLILKYKRKGDLKLIIDGDIDGALDILSYEWASLPLLDILNPRRVRVKLCLYTISIY